MQRFADAGLRSDAYASLAECRDESRGKDKIPCSDVMVCKLLRYAWNRRYDEFLRWELSPQEPMHGCPNLPAWV